MRELRIQHGTCHPFFCFEVGFSINLEAAARRCGGREQPALQHREHAAGSAPGGPFEFRPAPLRVLEPLGDTSLPGLSLAPEVELVLYDFGAASVCYAIPLAESSAELVALSVALRGHAGLAEDARRRMERLMAALDRAVERPRIASRIEDYFTFELRSLEGDPDAGTLCRDYAELLARVLRAETAELSSEEIGDAIEARISFGPRDVLLVDWNSAVIVDQQPGDLRAVLELANVQLLELRHLDDTLDGAMERSYQLLSRRIGWRGLLPGFIAEDTRHLSTLQIESAVLFERVTNALKFLGEEYLARVYRLAAGRLHLGDWGAAISRKLTTVDAIYESMSGKAASRRMELLEWVVILLIALEIVLALGG